MTDLSHLETVIEAAWERPRRRLAPPRTARCATPSRRRLELLDSGPGPRRLARRRMACGRRISG